MDRGDRWLTGAGIAAFLLQALAVVFHLGYWHLPLACLLAGLFGYRFFPDRALRAFFLLLPLLPAAADFRFAGFAYNLIALPLFALAGMLLGSRWRGERWSLSFAGGRAYRLFLGVLWISALFLFLRWSNLTLSLRAFLRDTPVATPEVRLGAALFIPVSTLLLYSFAPLVIGLLRQRRLEAGEALRWVSLGYLPSLALAAAQAAGWTGIMTESWWAVERRFNGGFSDFNAFGFTAGLLFLHHALQLLGDAPRREKGPSLLFLPLAVAGIGLSGTRSALVFVLAALVFFLARRDIRPRWKLAGAAALAAIFLLLGGTLRQRLGQMVDLPQELIGRDSSAVRVLNFLTNNRLLMLMDSAGMVKRYPLQGIGTGNFYNYRAWLHHRRPYYPDLALNQYLQVLDETGLLGLLPFLAFAWLLGRGSRPGVPRRLLNVTAVALLLSNFLWFPEGVLLLFTLVASASPGEPPPRSPRRWKLLAGAWLAAAVFANLAAFEALHPRTWCRQKSLRYDYGLWGFEKAAPGPGVPKFRWTGASAGVYAFRENPLRIRLCSAAPLEKLPGGRQTVEVYWRGRLKSRIVLDARQRCRDVLAGPADGLLEVRVRPTFVPARLGVGSDSRELGVQLFQLNR